jgi:hypothetical protein
MDGKRRVRSIFPVFFWNKGFALMLQRIYFKKGKKRFIGLHLPFHILLSEK